MRILTHFEQRSPEWFEIRRGKLSMSRAKDLLTGGKGKTRASYLLEVAAEILAPGFEKDHFSNVHMQRGIELETFAVDAYEMVTLEKVKHCGFVLADNDNIGCSPDGLTEKGGLEIKSPMPKNHLRYLDRDIVAAEHGAQIQGNMWVCERDTWDFVSFCPWVKHAPMIIHKFKRDEDTVKRLSDSALRGVDEVASLVEEARKFAPPNNLQKNLQNIASEAITAWQLLNAEYKGEVQL